jgi:flagellar export protein FliJ
MKRSQRLSRIVRLSSMAEKQAALAAARAESELGQLDAQQRELRHYQGDYLKRLGVGADGAVPGYEAQKLRVFVHKIEQALAGLDRKIAVATKRVERERQQWIQQQRRLNAIGDIATRVRGEELGASETRLQHEVDDRARPRADLE